MKWTNYHSCYGYPRPIAYIAEFWWRIEHLGYYRGGDGGLFGRINGFAYRERKRYERAGYVAATSVWNGPYDWTGRRP